MPIPTPFHPRTVELCVSQEWRNWSGYLAASTYEPTHEREYFAIRNSAGLIDVTPLFKYEITGADATRVVNRIITRNAAKCAIGQVMYTGWCDEQGKMIDDGTVSRLAENHYRITAADPSLRWFQDCGFGFDIEVVDVSDRLAALALQGPLSREILKNAVAGVDFEKLKFFYLAQGTIDRIPVTITRTGYTGDLGYEIWVASENALVIWDALVKAGRGFGIMPAGMVALDIARIEAGLLLIEVDYISSLKALTEARKSTPLELGLAWTVKLRKADFVGRESLQSEKNAGSKWQLVGLEVDWPDLEQLFNAADLPPLVSGRAVRDPVPVYQRGRQVGQVTSRTFSPILKKYIALASVHAEYAKLGTELEVETTVEFNRCLAKAKVVKTPFFDPERKRA